MPLKEMLIEYYCFKFNPNIKMQATFLDALGFKACMHCFCADVATIDALINGII